MAATAYLLLLLIGAAVVVADGQIIYHSRRSLLGEAYETRRRSRQITVLVMVLFHLVLFGVVALIAALGAAGNPGVDQIIVRIGLLLLVLAGGHAATVRFLNRLREDELGNRVAEAEMNATRLRHAPVDVPPPRSSEPPPGNERAQLEAREFRGPDTPP